MALDLSKIKSRLEGLKSNSKSKYMWKPNPGRTIVRLVPYKHQPDNPFVELYFHYGLNGKTLLSPSSFNRPDPIVEFANKLKRGSKEEWKEGRKIEPKMRVYVPIIVRGEESEGVRFWGIGKQLYQELLSFIADPDYGDITDIRTGRDIVVEVTSAKETGKQWNETKIRCKPNQTTAFDPSDDALKEAIKNQPDVATLWPELSYDELTNELNTWLNAPSEDAGAVPIDDDDDVSPTSTSDVTSATIERSETTTKKPSAQSVADEFDDLFKNA